MGVGCQEDEKDLSLFILVLEFKKLDWNPGSANYLRP